MKYKKYSKRTIIVASVVLGTVVCTILWLSTLRGIENKYSYVDNYSLSQDKNNIKEIELRDALRNYDEKNIVDAYVFLNDLDGGVTNAYITIICQEKNPNSEMIHGIKSFASEELGLPISNIDIDYIDVESFTSDERGSK